MAEEDREDRTEEPTQKRLDDAIARGDVPKSPDVVAFATLAMGYALAAIGLGGMTAALNGRFAAHLGSLDAAGGEAGLAAASALFGAGAAFVATPLAALLIAALAAGLAQHRPLWTTQPLAPKLERLSPLSNWRRLFGADALVPFLKGLAKTLALAAALWIGARPRLPDLAALVDLGPGAAAAALPALLIDVATPAVLVFGVFAAADLIWARVSWRRKLMMTREEIKREMKEQEGDPHLKARRSQIRTERSRRRMMAAVPTATVVIMNPTHFAVALRWEEGMAAPVCVAKGVDALALRIRDAARAAGVPVIENPTMARALHAAIDLDEPVPVEHWAAVAEIIGYVLRLARRRA